MKNLLKMAVVALALSCSQAYGHPVCVRYSHDHAHTQEEVCSRYSVGVICNIEDAICEADRLYKVIEVIRVRYYPNRFYFRVTFIDGLGERRVEIIDVACD